MQSLFHTPTQCKSTTNVSTLGVWFKNLHFASSNSGREIEVLYDDLAEDIMSTIIQIPPLITHEEKLAVALGELIINTNYLEN